MKKFFFSFLLAVLAFSSIAARGQTYTTIHWSHESDQKVADSEFFAFTAGLGVTSFADVRSAFQNKALGYQVNPILQPLMKAGELPTYATVGGIDLGITALGYEGKKHHWKLWYLPAAIGIGAHGVGFAWNIHIAR